MDWTIHGVSELPDDPGVGAALYLRRIDNGEDVIRFRVMISQQVLSDQAESQPFAEPPAQLGVHPYIGRNGLRRQLIDIVHAGVPREVAPQIHVRPELCLAPGV